MSEREKTYTYRGGERVELEKSADEFVVRALPEALSDSAIVSTEQVSSASTRVAAADLDLETAMERSRGVAPTHHAYYETESGKEFLITDRVFVTFRQPPADQQIDDFAARFGLIKLQSYGDRDFLFQLTNHTGMNPVKLVVELIENEDQVEMAEHDLNQRMMTNQFSVPSDPQYARQWHLNTRRSDVDYDTRSCAFCEESWRTLDDFGSDDVVVAVTDDGCKLDHGDFNGAAKFRDWGYLRGERLISRAAFDASADQMYKTGSNHGTSCCGVIAGEVDTELTAGAAPGCQLLPIQWESSGPSLFISDSKLLTVLEFIADKADIMSNSWGGVPTSLWATPVINRIEELSVSGGRRGKGIVFLWAAGNDNSLINHTADQDVPFSNGWERRSGSFVWVGVQSTRRFRNNLAELPGVMHIAALASTARRSHYSNYGPGVDLCAPSSNVHTYHRLTVRGLGITTATGDPGGVTQSFGGTSSATPLVAGVAALVISANSGLSAADVISILKKTAAKDLDFSAYAKTPPADFNNDTSWDVSPVGPFDTGDFTDAGDDGTWSPWFGHGKVDAQAAVAEAIDRLASAGTGNFQDSSAPDRSIPDNSDRGIKDKLTVAEQFTVESVKVKVDVSHTFIGDLRISLISPQGTTVVLHDRDGGSSNNLQVDYDSTVLPALVGFRGESVTGDWQLHVQDLAAQDRGRLKTWSLDISGNATLPTTVQESPGVTIPDNSAAGIERVLTVNQVGMLGNLAVDIDITHSFVSDLEIDLTSPDGLSVRLHNRAGGSSQNVIKTYRPENSAALNGFLGGQVSGEWRLQVTDRAGADQGKLNRWALHLTPN